jgi:hypothetical protein
MKSNVHWFIENSDDRQVNESQESRIHYEKRGNNCLVEMSVTRHYFRLKHQDEVLKCVHLIERIKKCDTKYKHILVFQWNYSKDPRSVGFQELLNNIYILIKF